MNIGTIFMVHSDELQSTAWNWRKRMEPDGIHRVSTTQSTELGRNIGCFDTGFARRSTL